jgi:hypothetical protein
MISRTLEGSVQTGETMSTHSKFLITIGPIEADKLWEVEKFCHEKDYPYKVAKPPTAFLAKVTSKPAPTQRATTGDDLDFPSALDRRKNFH